MIPILALEKEIETKRLNYMKQYYAEQSIDTKGICKADMLEIYACLVIKAELEEKRRKADD